MVCLRSQTRTFTALDGVGNTATVTRTVNWTADNTPPTFTGSYTTTDLGCNPADVNGALGTASATDGCGAVTITPSDGAVSSNVVFVHRQEHFTALDGCGNTATVTELLTGLLIIRLQHLR
jgi:hypothetical protein